MIFVKCNANDEKKIIFISQIDNIHQNNAKVSLYAFYNYFVQLDEIKLKFAQTGNFYNYDENKYFLTLIFIIYHKCTKRCSLMLESTIIIKMIQKGEIKLCVEISCE